MRTQKYACLGDWEKTREAIRGVFFMPPVQRGYAAALLQAMITGFSFLSVKIALQSAAATDLLVYRFGVAFFLALIPIAGGKVKLKPAPGQGPWILLLALFYPCLFFLLQTLGLAGIGSAEAGIIQAAAPIFTLLLASVWLKEKTTGRQRAFILLTVCGVVFISLMNGVRIQNDSFWGGIFILLSTLSMSAGNTLTRRLTAGYSPFTLSCLVTLPGFVFFLTLALISHGLSGTLSGLFLPLKSPSFICAVLYLGGPSSLGSSYLTAYALARLEASRVSVFSSLATVVALAAGVIFLRESLAWYHFAGTAMILAGVIGTNRSKTPDRQYTKL